MENNLFLTLPQEIPPLIFKNLPPKDLRSARLLCRYFLNSISKAAEKLGSEIIEKMQFFNYQLPKDIWCVKQWHRDDNHYIAIYPIDQNKVRVINLTQNKTFMTSKAMSNFQWMTIARVAHQKEPYLVIIHKDNTLTFLDTKSQQQKQFPKEHAHTKIIKSVQTHSFKGKTYLASLSNDHTIKVSLIESSSMTFLKSFQIEGNQPLQEHTLFITHTDHTVHLGHYEPNQISSWNLSADSQTPTTIQNKGTINYVHHKEIYSPKYQTLLSMENSLAKLMAMNHQTQKKTSVDLKLSERGATSFRLHSLLYTTLNDSLHALVIHREKICSTSRTFNKSNSYIRKYYLSIWNVETNKLIKPIQLGTYCQEPYVLKYQGSPFLCYTTHQFIEFISLSTLTKTKSIPLPYHAQNCSAPPLAPHLPNDMPHTFFNKSLNRLFILDKAKINPNRKPISNVQNVTDALYDNSIAITTLVVSLVALYGISRRSSIWIRIPGYLLSSYVILRSSLSLFHGLKPLYPILVQSTGTRAKQNPLP